MTSPIDAICAEHARALAAYLADGGSYEMGKMIGLEYAASLIDYSRADALTGASHDALMIRCRAHSISTSSH